MSTRRGATIAGVAAIVVAAVVLSAPAWSAWLGSSPQHAAPSAQAAAPTTPSQAVSEVPCRQGAPLPLNRQGRPDLSEKQFHTLYGCHYRGYQPEGGIENLIPRPNIGARLTLGHDEYTGTSKQVFGDWPFRTNVEAKFNRHPADASSPGWRITWNQQAPGLVPFAIYYQTKDHWIQAPFKGSHLDIVPPAIGETTTVLLLWTDPKLPEGDPLPDDIHNPDQDYMNLPSGWNTPS